MALISNLDNIEKYFTTSNINMVYKYIKQYFDKESEDYKRLFRHEIGTFLELKMSDGIKIYEQVEKTKKIEDCYIESHQKYIDFQFMVEGIEEMHYVDISKLEIDIDYNERKDLIVYGQYKNSSKFLLESGDVAIFFPEDGHMGLAMHKEASLIRKVVIKVPIFLIKDVV